MKMPGTPARCCSPEKKNALLERKRRRKADPGSLESCLPPLPFEDGRGGRQVSCAAVFPAEGGREKVKNEESPGNRAVLR